MTDKIFDLQLTDEQWQAYYAAVEAMMQKRKQNGTLLSAFDLIAGASLIFFLSGNNTAMPAKWVFAAVSDGMLPDGVMEEVEKLNFRIREVQYQLDLIEELSEQAQQLSKEIEVIRAKTKKMATASIKSMQAIDTKAFQSAVTYE
jgi:hypothetical protein